METFEFSGDQYKKASKHQKEWGNTLISELKLKGDEEILDLGCGDGVLTEQLSLLVPNGRVVGVDASLGMIQTAEKCAKNNLEFVYRDINTMNYKNEFDIVFSNAALHWIKDHHQLLKNSFTALKSHGAILWDFAGNGNCSNFFEVVRQKMNDSKYNEFFCNFEWPWFMPSKVYYEELAESIGFSKVEVTEVNRDRYFEDADEMIKWIDQPSLVPFLKYVPDDKKKNFREEVVESMIRKTQQSDGTCFETFRRIHISALK